MPTRFFRVKNEDRPDLAAVGSISQDDLRGYAFTKIFPIIPVSMKAGTLTVAPAGLTESKGTKGRSNGSALSGTALASVDVSWTAARFEGRGKIYEDDGAAYASEAACDAAGAELAQRLAWNKVEDEAFGKVFTSTRKSGATELADHAVIKGLQKKAKSLRKYGKPTLVMTTNTWLDFVEIPEIRSRLADLAKAGSDLGFILTDFEKVRSAVSTLLAFADIILFDSDIVDGEGTYDGCIAVIGLRPEAQANALQTVKTKAVYGWTPVYIPETGDGVKPFDMRSWYDEENKANVYDAEAFLGPTEAFSGGVAMTKLAASYTEYGPTVTVETGS